MRWIRGGPVRGVRGWRPAACVALAVVMAAGACGGGGGSDAGRGAVSGVMSGSTTTVPGATTLPDNPSTGKLTRADMAAWSGRAPAVTRAPVRLGLPSPPGEPGRTMPVDGVGETAIAVTAAGGKLVGCCVMVAVTVDQRERGLMQVTDFGGYTGMLFVWTADTQNGFWMQNTPTPLSIAWFDAGGHFVSSADMAPCGNRDDCPSYDPAGSYRFALEVPQGDLAKLGIGPGSTLHAGARCARAKAGA